MSTTREKNVDNYEESNLERKRFNCVNRKIFLKYLFTFTL